MHNKFLKVEGNSYTCLDVTITGIHEGKSYRLLCLCKWEQDDRSIEHQEEAISTVQTGVVEKKAESSNGSLATEA